MQESPSLTEGEFGCILHSPSGSEIFESILLAIRNTLSVSEKVVAGVGIEPT